VVLSNQPLNVPSLPSYGKPADHRPASKPQGIPVLQDWKSQKPLVSMTKKMFKLGKLKGKSGQVMSSRMKLPKPGKKHKVHFY
jgi:hypothetical protein